MINIKYLLITQHGIRGIIGISHRLADLLKKKITNKTRYIIN